MVGNMHRMISRKSIDNDASTNWHSGKQNTSTFTNEVIITLDELTTINQSCDVYE